ncbi:B-box zinc finger protein 20 [Dendrobium catenatum]|uniref:Putative salt tolerance-like protein n=1 Tax=Dendrobium catenatum TaxID=906689 RepID=A0A2I0VF23_9ASPA|nr:B-box zinc finger protein 20 [Dendrobium catenatum]PKU62010.1 putative salt tolerance-like protein [Dendrobium catenatum]
MKIQCDVCGLEAASVLCCADEAALCLGCDHRVHSANKLASKHRRVSLLHPSSKTLPPCDICKGRRGFVFCQDDRAILCKDCDLPIHSANTNTRKHKRFLLSGIRLSTAPVTSASTYSSLPTSETEMVSSSFTASSRVSEEDTVCSSHSTATKTANNNSGGSTISDYLMNMLPGWRVDDFLLDDAAAAGNLTGYNLISDPAVETETAGSSSGAWAWPGGAVTKMEDIPAWATPFPAAQATAMAQEGLYPLPDSIERGPSGWNEEASMVPQLQFQHKSKKRSVASLWY